MGILTILKPPIKRTNLAVVLVSVLLLGYIGFLVGTNYLWQVKLQESALEKSKDEVMRHATVLSYFFSERKDDLRNLTESREVAAFFENRALGMSMEYGLSASLFIMSRSFKRFAANRKIHEYRIYTRIVFIDTTGAPLVDTAEGDKAGPQDLNWKAFLHPGMQDAQVLVLHGASMLEMAVSGPCYFKNKYAGQIIAWISPRATYHLIRTSHIPLKGSIHILFKRHFISSQPKMSPEIPSEELPDSAAIKAGKVNFFDRLEPEKPKVKMIAISSPVQGTPLALVSISKSSELLADPAPWNMTLTMGMLAVIILAGSAIVFWINTKNHILHARLEETSKTRQEIEEKNLQLRAEIAQRSKAEESLRRETSITHALAEISNAILLPSSIEELSEIVLERAKLLTKSKAGYVGYIELENGSLVCPTFSSDVLDQCRITGKETAFKESSGLRGWVLNNRKTLMTNAPESDPRFSGMPKGHIPVKRFLCAPALFEGMLLGQVSVANAQHDYTQEDVVTVERLAALYAIALKRRRDAELLRKVNTELEQRVRERTAELTAINELLIEEIEDRKRAEKELGESEKRMRQLIEISPIGISIHRRGRYVYINPAFVEMFGYQNDYEILGIPVESLMAAEYKDLIRQRPTARSGERKVPRYELKGLKRSGERFDVAIWMTPIDYEGQKAVLAFVIDTSLEKRLEAQLIQAQKMEAIGRLAGGVAHDFNNLTTIIMGHAELLMMNLKKNAPLYADAEEIKKAGARATSLTRQLLAFSRRQILQPKILNVNDVIADMEKMIMRIIGEDIEIVMALEPGLGKVEVDPGQLEQVIMNLAVNARDAMPLGGKLTINTANQTLGEDYARKHGLEFECKPGLYVMLSLSDTGSGMDKETQKHIFEPFFTTKERGKGTGLGLATVYGVVKQSRGYVLCHSEPGQGTIFKIYLPRVEEAKQAVQRRDAIELSLRGSETILLVEDDEALRNIALRVLRGQGYTVLEAQNGEDALEVSEQHKGPIHLLLTDVVMPGMNGGELERHLKNLRPWMKVIFMSGYTNDSLVLRQLLDGQVTFLQKPFTSKTLLGTVRKVLNANVS